MSSKLLKLFAAALLLPASAAVVNPHAQGGRAEDCGMLVQSSKFDEYGDLPDEEERSRLDKLVAALKAEPEDTKAFIIGYAGRDVRAGGGLARADRAKRILTDSTGLINTRLNTIDCGRRESPATEIWLTPAGAAPPRCTPTLDPTPAPARRPARRPSRRP